MGERRKKQPWWPKATTITSAVILSVIGGVNYNFRDWLAAAARQHVHSDGTSHGPRDGLHFGTIALDPAPIAVVAPALPLRPERPAALPVAPPPRWGWSPLQPQGP